MSEMCVRWVDGIQFIGAYNTERWGAESTHSDEILEVAAV